MFAKVWILSKDTPTLTNLYRNSSHAYVQLPIDSKLWISSEKYMNLKIHCMNIHLKFRYDFEFCVHVIVLKLLHKTWVLLYQFHDSL